MRSLAEAMRSLVEAMRSLVEAMRSLVEAMRSLAEAVHSLSESVRDTKISGFTYFIDTRFPSNAPLLEPFGPDASGLRSRWSEELLNTDADEVLAKLREDRSGMSVLV